MLAPDDTGVNPTALYAGGAFTTAGGLTTNGIAKWNGSAWSALGSGMNNDVRALAIDAVPNPHPVYAGGFFTTAGGTPANHIAKWSGSSWSALGGGTDSVVYALTFFDDGTGTALYAGGAFTMAGGNGASHIAKWDESTSTWSALGTGTDGTVYALATFDDGTGPALYVGGTFTVAGGINANNVAKWKGSWSALGGGVTHATSPVVQAMTVFDDDGPAGPHPSGLYVGGFFTAAGGISALNIAKWDTTGWSPVGAVGRGTNDAVSSLTVFDDDGPAGPHALALYAGGAFTTAGGMPANHIGKWNGSVWSGLTGGVNGDVYALSSFDDDGPSGLHLARLCVGGLFTSASGVSVSNIAEWNGSTWSALNSGLDNQVLAVIDFDDDGAAGPNPPALYAGGYFTTAGGFSASHVAKWNGLSWSALGTGMNNGTNGPVSAFTVFDTDGSGPNTPDLYVGGSFSAAGGTTGFNNIAKWNGSSWSMLGVGTNADVNVLAVFDDGTGPAIYAGGSFVTAGGVSANHVAKWNGSTWSSLPPATMNNGVNNTVYALAVFDDDGPSGPDMPALYAGGAFTMASGVSVNYIARWDGTMWSTLSGMNVGPVRALTVFDDDGTGPNLPALYAGGDFTTAGGAPANHIAKLLASSWSSLGSGTNNGTNGSVYALTVFDDDGAGPNTPGLYLGGAFTTAGIIMANYIARWNAPTTSWSPLNAGMNSVVLALHDLDDDGSGPHAAALFAGGLFSAVDNRPSTYIARWVGCGSSIASFCVGDGSGGACPCGNSGVSGRGCDNSAATGGASLSSTGNPDLTNDTLALTSAHELSNAFSIFLQGNASVAPVLFGDGLRCAGGSLKRLYSKNAAGGTVTAPVGSDVSISSRSSTLGDPIPAGGLRYYQTYYRDPNLAFCPNPPGDSWNVSNGLAVTWSP